MCFFILFPDLRSKQMAQANPEIVLSGKSISFFVVFLPVPCFYGILKKMT